MKRLRWIRSSALSSFVIVNGLILSVLPLSTCSRNDASRKTLKTEAEKFSYSIGVELGNDLRYLQIRYPDLDPAYIAQGVLDVLERRALLANERELLKVKLRVENEMMEKEARARMKRDPEFEAWAEKNQKESEEFLAENRKREGVQVTASGLQYEILRPGSGKSPGLKDEVLINFHGMLIDGTEFDSSQRQANGPVKLRVQHLVRGFAEALQMMKEGAKWKIYLPAELAYGMGGREPLIGPNAALIFEVELLEVIPNQYEYSRRR